MSLGRRAIRVLAALTYASTRSRHRSCASCGSRSTTWRASPRLSSACLVSVLRLTCRGTIDRAFFPESLPTPTLRHGGILWPRLTLALLTVPVVICRLEEALAAVPRSMREASLAMGATKFQTILRVVLPRRRGLMTGLIWHGPGGGEGRR